MEGFNPVEGQVGHQIKLTQLAYLEAYMKRNEGLLTKPMRAALVAGILAISYVGSVSALDLPFSQTAGFFAGATATVSQPSSAPPVQGKGGLEFSGLVVGASGPPVGTNTAPINVWKGVAWGCTPFSPSPANCANLGVIGNGLNYPDAFASTSRSALEVTGKFGNLTELVWTDVTTVRHHNSPIDGASNVLRTVDIHAILRLGALGTIVDTPSPTITKVTYFETPNGTCNVVPVTGAPLNPLGSICDDFVIVSGIDLASSFLPAGAVGNPVAMFIDFRLSSTTTSGALVCDGKLGQPAACAGYTGPDTIIYTAEGGDNSLTVQARLRPADVGVAVPLFVIGDVEPHAIGDVVNFWGAQWWNNNFMSGFVSKGVASFKGYANKAEDFCGGRWESRPGNSSNPPATIPDEVAIIVTDTVLKVGPSISGTIKQILLVRHDGAYGPNPGHRGSGPVTKIICTQP